MKVREIKELIVTKAEKFEVFKPESKFRKTIFPALKQLVVSTFKVVVCVYGFLLTICLAVTVKNHISDKD